MLPLQIFDLATKEYREPDQSDTMIPPEPWQPPQPPPGAVLGPNMQLGGLAGIGGEKRRSGSGRPKGSKDKTQRRPRSAAAQEFEKEVVGQLTAFCGGLSCLAMLLTHHTVAYTCSNIAHILSCTRPVQLRS